MRSTVLLIAILSLAACAPDAPAAPPAAQSSAPAVVDSIFPPEEAMRRFRAGLPEVDSLSGGASSRGELVRRFVRAVEKQDTAELRTLLMNRAEFAYLYFPTSRFARPPLRTDPALLWFQMQMNSEKGIVRLLRRKGGTDAGFRGHACEDTPVVEGENRLWERCTVRLTDGAEDRWFGTVIERGGRYKMVGYANGL
ncbi:MAG TPA: hypothetical protein VGB92_23310 [Longimicrobium sp.]